MTFETSVGDRTPASKSISPRHPHPFALLLRRIRWFNLSVEVSLPLLTVYGICTTAKESSTLMFCLLCYFLNMIGITAGYHRLWSHRSYNASLPLQYFLAVTGGAAIQGSIYWWARGHRSHHRYTDTDLDPYGAHRGLWHTHLGWMLVKPTIKPGFADITDLSKNSVVMWQHRWYFHVVLFFGIILPTSIPGYFWGDWRGGFFYAGFARLLLVHHSVFSVNSVAHWLGETTYDDKLTPRDHILTALLTLGEGYHNFHHQFPMDYRNAIRWYQYDPTKWFIALCYYFGLASHLKLFPDGEIRKGQLTMQLKRLKIEQDRLPKPPDSKELPVVSWESFQEQSRACPLVLVSGFIHDVSDFLDEHPGGRRFLETMVGRDATTAFLGGTYDHSNAAHNLLSNLRVGVLHGGLEHISDVAANPPWRRLEIIDHGETH
ncbi:delta 9-fatty acid desaturase protein [Artomyces pyxidatus]|uniref:Delta 9-fatty acid desaturase protein n=1 Tax=Artomyces pyxidatus TaxID=48021 RepID=A0ACB8TLE3_9AGAM|nr:delta 9-fatty acid desaturase protein [Artomyces pyxidatus]